MSSLFVIEQTKNRTVTPNVVAPTMSNERLAHYRAKLVQLDATGYGAIVNVIAEDTIREHNSLGNDLRAVENAVRSSITLTALTQRKRNRKRGKI